MIDSLFFCVTYNLRGKKLSAQKKNPSNYCIDTLSISNRPITTFAVLDTIEWLEDVMEWRARKDAFRKILSMLRIIKLVDRVKVEGADSRKSSYKFVIKDFYRDYKIDLEKKFATALCEKRLEIRVEQQKVPSNLNESEHRFTKYLGTSTYSIQGLRQELVKNLDTSKLDAQQKHSVKNSNRVCQCGTKVVVNGKVCWTGFHRRMRCRKCDNCKRPKCGECVNCNTPSNKQCCIEKVCATPIIPDDCPAFSRDRDDDNN